MAKATPNFFQRKNFWFSTYSQKFGVPKGGGDKRGLPPLTKYVFSFTKGRKKFEIKHYRPLEIFEIPFLLLIVSYMIYVQL